MNSELALLIAVSVEFSVIVWLLLERRAERREDDRHVEAMAGLGDPPWNWPTYKEDEPK